MISEQIGMIPHCELKVQCYFTLFWKIFMMVCLWSVRTETSFHINVKNICGHVLLICDKLLWEWCRSTRNYVRKLFRFQEVHLSVRDVGFTKTPLSTNPTQNNISTFSWLNNQKQDWCLNPQVYLPPFWSEVSCSLFMGDVNRTCFISVLHFGRFIPSDRAWSQI